MSIYILYKHPKTLALKCLFIYGLSVTVWEFATFFQRTAPNVEISAFFFALLTLFTHLSLALYLATVLSVREERKWLPLTLYPVIATSLAVILRPVMIILTEFGWSYTVVQYDLPYYTITVVYVFYLAVTNYYLLELVRKARSYHLKRKYQILYISYFVFQTVGFPLSNYQLISNLSFPPIGGILNLFTFVFIVYAILIKEEEVLSPPTVEIRDFSKVYSSFLTTLYNSTIETSLGEKSFKFVDFVKESGIEKQVTISERKIKFDETKDLDIIELINKNLEILKTNFKNAEVVNYYLRVLNSAYVKIGKEFEKIIRDNDDFLKKTDLLYGISGGAFLNLITEDSSLDEFSDIDACLKIYKRILLLMPSENLSSADSRKRLAMYYATKDVEISEYGEVSMQNVMRSLGKVTKDEQLPIIIESFNSYVSWMYEHYLNTPGVDAQKILENLNTAFRLNRIRAVKLNVYQLFLERLSARIPIAQIQKFYSELLEELVEEKTGELRETQRHLLEAQRMAVIGETAAMVGHDLRNPLQVIFDSIYLLRTRLGKSSLPSNQKQPIDKIINLVNEQAQYMNKIVSDLQDYAKPISLEITDCEVEKMVKAAMSVLMIPQNVKISLQIEDGAQVIPMDPTLMNRVFINLLMNAVQAMPHGGHLTVTARRENENAVISFTDTGKGIAKENLGKLFTPLFTTKAKGQGFGLAVCKRLIEAHGGRITAENEINKGAKFIITLPLEKSGNNRQAAS